ATVTAGGTPGAVAPPSGVVTFKDNGTTIGTANTPVHSGTPAPGGSDAHSLVTTTLSVGTHTNITADFAPTGNFSPSSGGPVTVTINPAAACSFTGSNCTDQQNIQVTINNGSLVISTPYHSTNPFVLPAMTLNTAGTLLSTSATFPATTDQP